MKKFIGSLLSVVLIAFILLAASLPMPAENTAYAASLDLAETLTIYHMDTEKSFAVDSDLFTFKSFTQPNSKKKTSDLSVVEITTAPYSTPGGFLLQKHVVNALENFYIQSGEFEFVGFQPNKTVKVSAGDVVRVPAGVPYGYKNTGSEPGTVLLISPSNGLEKFVAEVGTSVEDKDSHSVEAIQPDTVQTDINKLATVARQYGIEFLN